MPCWEVNTVTLEFKAKNIEIMLSVLESMNLSPSVNRNNTAIYTDIGTFNLKTGEVDVRSSNQRVVNKFRVKYSEKVISIASKKFGWKIKTGKRIKGKQTFVASKW